MAKSTGIVRKIDDLGRVVIPMEIRRTMDISEGDPLEIFVDGDLIILRKYSPGCILCGTVSDDLKSFRNKNICPACIKALPR